MYIDYFVNQERTLLKYADYQIFFHFVRTREMRTENWFSGFIKLNLPYTKFK